MLKSKLPILPDHIFLTETKYEMKVSFFIIELTFLFDFNYFKKWLAVIHDEINKTDEMYFN